MENTQPTDTATHESTDHESEETSLPESLLNDLDVLEEILQTTGLKLQTAQFARQKPDFADDNDACFRLERFTLVEDTQETGDIQENIRLWSDLSRRQ